MADTSKRLTSPAARRTPARRPGGTDASTALRDALRQLRIELAMNTRQIAAAAGLRESDLDVLDVLDRDGPQSPTTLARRMGIHAATMTGVLTRLENAGWLERRRDLADRRSVQIESTGFDRLSDLYRDANSRLDDIATTLPTRQATAIIEYLHQVTTATREATVAISADEEARHHAETQ